MTKAQSNYFNMAKAVCDVFSNSTVWKGNELVGKNVEKINGLCRKINDEAVKQQDNRTPGYTNEKERERTLLEDRLYQMAVRLRVYAQLNADKVLEDKINFSRSSLDQKSLNHLLTLARTIAGNANKLDIELEPYEISQVEIGNLNKSIDTVERLNAHRDALKSEHAENTTHLELIFGELRPGLKLMDTLVEAFVSDEEFLRTYFIARRVHDIRGGAARKPGSGEKPAAPDSPNE